MDIQVVDVTPCLAQELLDFNTENFRKLNSSLIAKYATEMKRGKWELNGESIKLNGKVLLDGQHRLHAVIKAGVSVKMVIAKGLQCGSHTIDRGKNRTLAQWLHHAGFPSARDCASVTLAVAQHQHGKWISALNGGGASWSVVDSDLLAVADKYRDSIIASVRLARRARSILSPAILAPVLLVGCEYTDVHDHELPRWFVEAMHAGVGLENTEPVLHLRNRLLESSPRKSLTSATKRMMTVLAWNKTVLGQECTSSQFIVRMSGPSKTKPQKEILSCIQ